jgi:hypothetical protein
MKKPKEITATEYNKIMDRIIRKYGKKPIAQVMIALLDAAAKYRIKL